MTSGTLVPQLIAKTGFEPATCTPEGSAALAPAIGGGDMYSIPLQ